MASTRPIKLDEWGISWEEYKAAFTKWVNAMQLKSVTIKAKAGREK